MTQLLDADFGDKSYRDIVGPFKEFPNSLLEDLLLVIYQEKGLPKELLHQLILPQLEV